MPLASARPVKRSGSSFIQFRSRIPKDVLAKARGMTLSIPVGSEWASVTITDRTDTVAISLRTRDQREGKRRHAEVAAHMAATWQGLRDGAVTLTLKEIAALAGELYREHVSKLEDEPGPPSIHEFIIKRANAVLDPPPFSRLMIPPTPTVGEWFGPTVDRLLSERNLVVDAHTRQRLLVAVGQATLAAAEQLKRNAEHDFTPDTKAARFPKWHPPSMSRRSAQGSTTLSGLFEGWTSDPENRDLATSTRDSYRRTVHVFVKFLGHDDATRVTGEDVEAFKVHRLTSINARSGRPLSSKTVRDGDLAALKSIFRWAVEKRRLLANPAAGITLRRTKGTILRKKSFTDAEASTVLRHALEVKRGGMNARTFAAKRWGPWLCAYTGARVGEILQLRKEDVRLEGDTWVITITPEAGTVKTKEAREVPLHYHLVELGFPKFVAGAPSGHLFFTTTGDGDNRGRWQAVKNRVAEFVREVVPDRRVAPNHAWRHLFKTKGRQFHIESLVLDAICGHAPASDGDKYGDVTLRTMIDALATFPRFEVDKLGTPSEPLARKDAEARRKAQRPHQKRALPS